MAKAKLDAHKLLADAADVGALVRIRRAKLERSYDDAYVVAVSPKLVLLQPVTGRLDFDGYKVVRTKDVTSVAPPPFVEFLQRALDLKRVKRPPPPAIDLSTTGAMMASAQALFPLLVIHRERISNSECEVGRLVGVEAKTYRLKEIDPGAAWLDEEATYRRAEVTAVEFDGDYENALALVAAGAPSKD